MRKFVQFEDMIIGKKEVNSDLMSPEKAIIFPRQGCIVKGNIHAGSVIAEGPLTVKGNIISETLIAFWKEAKISGLITAKEEIICLRDLEVGVSINSDKFIEIEGRLNVHKGSATTVGKLQAKKGICVGSWIIADIVKTEKNIVAGEYIRAREIYAGEYLYIETEKISGEIKSGFWLEKNKES